MNKRDKPCLCIECPDCGAVFHAIALHKDFFNDAGYKDEFLDEIIDKAQAGFNISVKNVTEFELNYCDHLK